MESGLRIFFFTCKICNLDWESQRNRTVICAQKSAVAGVRLYALVGKILPGKLDLYSTEGPSIRKAHEETYNRLK